MISLKIIGASHILALSRGSIFTTIHILGLLFLIFFSLGAVDDVPALRAISVTAITYSCRTIAW